jgi:hypothetical protein
LGSSITATNLSMTATDANPVTPSTQRYYRITPQ